MRLSPSTLAVLTAGLLALAGCGGSDEVAETTSTASTTPTVTDAAPTVTTQTPTETQSTVQAPPTSTATATAPPAGEDGSGGTTPPVETATAEAPPVAGGDQPQIALRGDGTARATAADGGQAEIWCDAARQGSYAAQLGDATTLVIAVSGSDQVTRCTLGG